MHILLYRVDQLAAGMAIHRVKLAVETFKLHLARQVGAVAIQQHADRRRRQEARQLQMLRRLRFDHVDHLHQQRADRQRLVFQQRQRAAAGVAGEDQIQAVAD